MSDSPSPLQIAVECLARGDAAEALQAASEACWREPRRAEAHYVYGQAFQALGRAAEAERAFAEAVRLRPGWADAWVNYGLARYARGAIEDAKTAMRQALGADPGHAGAVANLGAFLRITGQVEAAEALLTDFLNRNPAAHGARLNLAAELLQEERGREALALLDAAPAPPEDLRTQQHWRLQRALARLQEAEAEEAAAELQAYEALGPVPPAQAPLWRWRRLLLARLRGHRAAARAEAEAMQAALTSDADATVLEHAIMARFDLAKFWSGEAEAARAFAQWTAGHDLLSRVQPFSRDAHRAFIDANIERLESARFLKGPRAANRDAAPVFIVGMPRSGTTLAEQILGAHRNVHAAGERSALGTAFQRFGGETPEAVARMAETKQAALDAMGASYLAELHALSPDKTRIIDKMPGNFNYLGLAGLILPRARVVHCVRDPRDTGLSIFTFRFHGHHPYAHRLDDLGWYIGEHDRLMRHWKSALRNPIFTLRLSDWVDDFAGTLGRLLDFCGLPPDPNCARFHEGVSRVRTVSRSQVRQPVNARGLGRWRAYASELAPMIAELEKAGSLEGW